MKFLVFKILRKLKTVSFVEKNLKSCFSILIISLRIESGNNIISSNDVVYIFRLIIFPFTNFESFFVTVDGSVDGNSSKY